MPRSRRNLHKRKFLWPIVVTILVLVSGIAVATYFYLKPGEKPKDATVLEAEQETKSETEPVTPLHVATSSAETNSVVLHIPILMYHYIEHVKDKKDTIRQSLDILPETLDAQLKAFDENGYTYLYASEVAAALDSSKPLPAKSVVLTFDDGYQDFYTDALPILLKHHAKATAYIITGFIGKPNYMTMSQLSIVQQSGIVELGAHTVHHIDLKHASDEKATVEIDGSRASLQKWFNIPATSFAYPGGRFNDHTLQIVKGAGFTNAVSTLPGTEATVDNRFTLFRLRPGSRTGKNLLSFIQRMLQ